jgi:uncharacterized peroxidase-related enzyme
VTEPKAWIEMIPVADAEGELAEYYKKWHRPDGGVDNILRIHSLNPQSLAGHYEYYAHIMRGESPLSRSQREMIAVVVSATNHCHY